ncbi:uncharacterized protein LOC124887049 [Capsicum annuum]|uniref:uncharacterized protein LOC124887049 n=1 Tax=Capsicum annuum TaxID=4072 RepID=UPI001FB18041|nr:uncharacterized protein LOC124887049 [Capsicum annuum]
MTYSESVEQKASDEQDYEEYDKSMMPENLPHKIEKLESQKKRNMDETEVIDLGDEETKKETRVSIYLEAERKQELRSLLKQYINLFVDCFTRYHQILMDENDAEKIAFITPWGVYCYRVYIVGADLLRIDLGCAKVKAPPVRIYHVLNFENRSTQVYLSEANAYWKGGKMADLVENQVDQDHTPPNAYFSNKKVLFAGEDILEPYDRWRMFFDGVANFKGVRIGAVLVSEIGQHYPISAKIRFPCTNNMAEYEACILGLRMAVDMDIKKLLVIGDLDLLIHQVQGEWTTKNVKILPYVQCVKELSKRFTKIEFKHVPQIQNEFADALAILSSMIQHPDKNYIDPIKVEIRDQQAYYFHVDEEPDGTS